LSSEATQGSWSAMDTASCVHCKNTIIAENEFEDYEDENNFVHIATFDPPTMRKYIEVVRAAKDFINIKVDSQIAFHEMQTIKILALKKALEAFEVNHER
jgi:hypothetical protein